MNLNVRRDTLSPAIALITACFSLSAIPAHTYQDGPTIMVLVLLSSASVTAVH